MALIGFGLALATIARWAMLLFAVSIPKNRSVFIALMLLSGALGMAALTLGTGSWLGNIAAGLAIFAGVFFLLTVAIGKQTGGPGVFQVGSVLPSFTAPDENNQLFDSSSLSGQPILLKFFRGHW